ncbi:MAG: hypothetical protein HY962_06240 [Ignavibacteriae bacterium]|nr:hypothetical protein [Ignavibacteriota bacterium]
MFRTCIHSLLPACAVFLCTIAPLPAQIQELAQIPRSAMSLNFEEVKQTVVGDYNGDIFSDIVTRSSSTVTVLDALTLTPLYTFQAVSGDTSRRLLGFARFNGQNGPVSVMFLERVSSSAALVIRDAASNGVVFRAEGDAIPTETMSLNIVVLHRSNGRDVLCLSGRRGVLVIGEKNGVRGGDGGGMSAPQPARMVGYDVQLKYAAPPGLRLAFSPRDFSDEARADFNGDGVSDLLLRNDTSSGDPKGLVVVSGDDLKELLTIPLTGGQAAALRGDVHGFADVDGDGIKELYAGTNAALTTNGAVHTIAPGITTLALADIDGDGRTDILALRLRDTTLVVYGTSAPTGVAAAPVMPDVLTLHPAYPNPSASVTLLPVTLRSSAPLRVAVTDAAGRTLRVLHDGPVSAGMHLIPWDGADDTGARLASGTYQIIATSGVMLRALPVIRIR